MISVYLSVLEEEYDKQIFQRLYEENRQRLCHVAKKIVHNEADAEDAVHTCFLHLAENFSRYKNQPYEELEKLCSTITRNAATDIMRRYEREGDFTNNVDIPEEWLPDPSMSVEDEVEKKQRDELIEQALMELDEDERYLMYLQYAFRLKPQVIGALLSLPSAKVRKKTWKCRNKLKKILEEYKDESI